MIPKVVDGSAGWNGKAVEGVHQKYCTLCRKSHWEIGSFYYTDFRSPTGAHKLCEKCIEIYAVCRGWMPEGQRTAAKASAAPYSAGAATNQAGPSRAMRADSAGTAAKHEPAAGTAQVGGSLR